MQASVTPATRWGNDEDGEPSGHVVGAHSFHVSRPNRD